MALRTGGFHDGELHAQQHAGVAAEAQRLAGMLTEPNISGGMSGFIAERELAFLTAEDRDGRLWTSPVFGPRGSFVGIGRRLGMARTPADGDPLQELRPGQSVGALLVDFDRRRRLRVNGVVDRYGPDGLGIEVEQAFGNCPRHITPRPASTVDDLDESADTVRRFTRLEPEDIAQITAADTFVLGTLHPQHGAPPTGAAIRGSCGAPTASCGGPTTSATTCSTAWATSS